MSDTRLNLLITADNRRFINSFSRSEAKIKSFGKRISGMTRRAKTEFGGFGNKISGLTGLAAGIVGVAAGKQVIDFDTRLARLAIQARLTKKQMFELKDELFKIGDLTLQAPEELLAGIEQIVEKTGKFEFAKSILKDIGVVATASSTMMRDIGATSSDLMEKFRFTKEEMFGVFDILISQGKEGAFTLRDMAQYFAELLPAAKAFEVSGVRGLRQFGALLQISMQGSGTAAKAADSARSLLAEMTEKYREIYKMTGFSIIDPEKSKKAGRPILKELDVVLKGIIKGAKGNTLIIEKLFGETAVRPMKRLANIYNEFGNFEILNRLIEMGGDGTETMQDFAFWSDTTAAKIRDFTTELSKFTNQNLAKPIELLTTALDYLNKHPALTNNALYALLGGLGMWGTAKVGGGMVKALSSLRYIITGKGKGAATVLPMLKSLLTSSAAKVGLAGGAGYGAGTLINEGAGWVSGKLTDDKYSGSGWLGNMFYDWRHPEDKKPDKLNIAIKNNIRIDEKGRVFTETDRMDTMATTTLKRGRF